MSSLRNTSTWNAFARICIPVGMVSGSIWRIWSVNFLRAKKTIPHWAQDYRKLRGLRRTRNTLAHNVSEYQVCTEQDVENVIDFVDRIMQQQDPLAMLNLYNSKDEESETMDESEVSVPGSFYYDAPRNEKKGKQLILGVVLLVITCVMVILVSILISHIA